MKFLHTHCKMFSKSSPSTDRASSRIYKNDEEGEEPCHQPIMSYSSLISIIEYFVRPVKLDPSHPSPQLTLIAHALAGILVLGISKYLSLWPLSLSLSYLFTTPFASSTGIAGFTSSATAITASSHFPPFTPYLHPIYPTTPSNPPVPPPPTSIFQPACLIPVLAATIPVPATAPNALNVSHSTWPLFSSSRQLRSCHSISSLPHIRASRPTAINATPMAPPVPEERSRVGRRAVVVRCV